MTTSDIIYTDDQKSTIPGLVRISELSNDILFPNGECNKAHITKVFTDLGIPVIPVKSPMKTWDSQRGEMYQIWQDASKDPSLLTGPNAEGYEDWNAYFKHPVEIEWQNKPHMDPRAWDRNEILYTYEFQGKKCAKKGNPDFNIGYPVECGIVVVDLDMKNGIDGIKEFCEVLGVKSIRELGKFYATRTPSGGIHIPFKTDEIYSNTAGQIAPGVDIRSLNGFVMLPGSSVPTPSGWSHYTIASSGPIPTIPERLAERLKAIKAKPKKLARVVGCGNADDGLSEILKDETHSEPIRKGTRHDRLKAAFSDLRGMIEDDDQFEAACRKYVDHHEVGGRGKIDTRNLIEYFVQKEYTGPVKLDVSKMDWCSMENVDDLPKEEKAQIKGRFLLGDDAEFAKDFISQIGADKIVYSQFTFWKFNASKGIWERYETIRKDILDQYSNVWIDKKPVRMGAARVIGIEDTIIINVQNDKFFESEKSGIACRNGFWYFKDFQILSRPHSPDNRKRSFEDYDFDPKAESEVISPLYDATFQNPEARRLVDEFIGVTKFGKITDTRKSLWIYGKKRTGKSTILSTIGLLFENHHCSVSPHSMGENFRLTPMVDAKVNLVFEVHNGKINLRASDVFKCLVAGDPVFIEAKGKDGYHTTLNTAQIYAINRPPQFDDQNGSVSDRILAVETKQVYTEEMAKPQSEILEECRKDLPNFVAELARAFIRFSKRKHFEAIEETRRLAVQFKNENSYDLSSFQDECLEYGSGYETTSEAVYLTYQTWHRQVFGESAQCNTSKIALMQKLTWPSSVKVDVRIGTRRGFSGVRVKQEYLSINQTHN